MTANMKMELTGSSEMTVTIYQTTMCQTRKTTTEIFTVVKSSNLIFITCKHDKFILL
jgi:hypothetical protein